MKNIFFAMILLLYLSSCEVEYRGDARYHHPRGYEHAHHPDHHEVYHQGYHHDAHGAEIIVHP